MATKKETSEPVRKATVRKWVNRKISTAQYESVDISAEITEEIEFTDDESKAEAMNNLSRVLVVDLHRTIAQVLDELELDRSKAQGKKMTFDQPGPEANLKSNKSSKSLNEIFDGL